MTQLNDISLCNFFVFNPGFSKSEGEEEKKILYYYPQVEKDVQLKSAGLCEALIKFTASFHPDKPCEVFCTEKTKQMLYEPEPGFWMAMTVSADPSSNVKVKGDPSDLIQENICDAILKLAYRMFHMFSGSFKSVMVEETDGGINALREKLEHFYETYLLSLDIEHSSLLDVFQGIQYLPLGREPFLHVQSFINTVEVKFSSVTHSAFLYNDHLVWSGIDPNDMQVLYQYLIRTLLPSHPDLELQGGSLPGSSPGSTVHYGSFVTGPADLMDEVVSSTKVPKVYLHCGLEIRCFHLVVYRVLSATLCLFLPEPTNLSLQLFKSLETHIGPRLTTLVSEISQHCVRNSGKASKESDARFIYFNKLNLAIKSSVLEARKGGPPTLAPDIMRLLSGINADKSLCCDNGEYVLSTLNDTWVVVKVSNGREFYIITHKKPSLKDIGAEVKKICNTQLKGIFFMT